MAAKIPDGVTDRELLQQIWSKMTSIDALHEKVDSFIGRINSVEKKVAAMDEKLEEMERGVSHIETEFESQRTVIDRVDNDYVTRDELRQVQNKLVDMGNRSRRNNIRINNIPEGKEGTEYNCHEFVESFVKESLELDGVEIESAHRVGFRRRPPPRDPAADGNDENEDRPPVPRPIIARCLRRNDRNKILEAAPKSLKGKLVYGQKVYVSDDVEPATREIHRKLVEQMNFFRSQDMLAYIPWTVPRVLKYRERPNAPLKTYRV